MKRGLYVIPICSLLAVAPGTAQGLLTRAAAQAQRSGGVPAFKVDANWPKPLPNNWLVGQVNGVAIDSRDHVWILHRPRSLDDSEKAASTNPPGAECCIPAPPILEFDAEGNLLHAWGGLGVGYEWPDSEHGLFIDHKDNIWLTGNPHVALKFTRDGKFLLQLGKKEKTGGSNDTTLLGNATDLAVNPKTNELYLSDGYANDRVIVFDADTGAYKRHWGAYGNKPTDAEVPRYDPRAKPSQQFNTPHGIALSNDGLVYVSDRANDRIQAFQMDGKFVKEGFVAPQTLIHGSAWGLDLSRDPQQRYVYVADGVNMKVWILTRDNLQTVGSFGRSGRSAGQFHWLHTVAVDSKGNVYTAEVGNGKRTQKFVAQNAASTAAAQ